MLPNRAKPCVLSKMKINFYCLHNITISFLVGTFQIKDESVLLDTLRTSLKAGYTLIGDRTI